MPADGAFWVSAGQASAVGVSLESSSGCSARWHDGGRHCGLYNHWCPARENKCGPYGRDLEAVQLKCILCVAWAHQESMQQLCQQNFTGNPLDPDFEQANLDEFRKSQRGETKRRTRLRPEDLLEKPDQNIKPPQNGKQ
eukprot:608030-Pelagomonas_calceolata.AAC.2